MDWAAAATALFTLVAMVLEAVAAAAPARKKEAADDAKNDLRTAIASGDVAAVGIAIDGVQQSSPSDTPVLGSDEDTARRIAKITGG